MATDAGTAGTHRLRVGEALIDLLARHYGVDVVFGIPGVHNIELYRGLHRSGVRTVSPRHEQGAGFMADGWSVVTGRPGVCVLISGPGLTNAITPIAQAYHDSRPMLVLASTTPTDALGKGFGPLHDLPDQSAVVRTLCAFSNTVDDPAQLPDLIERAWDVFASGRPRPVHLAIPTDVLEQFVDPFPPPRPARKRPTAADADLERAAALLAAADEPVIVVGGGAVDAGAGVLVVAERLDAPVVLSGNAKGVLASSHPLCVDAALGFDHVQQAVEAADVVLVVGSELSDADLYNGGRALRFTGALVRIDLDREQLPRRIAPDLLADTTRWCPVVGDAADALDRLLTFLPEASPRRPHSGADRAAALRIGWRASTRADLVPWLEAIAHVLPPDAIVALDSTQLAYAAHTWLPAERPRSWLAPYGLGTLGCALPMAIGAQIAAPDRPVLAVAGDGGWLFTVAEMATACDLDLPVVLVVWDNRGYAQIRQSFDDAAAPRMGVDVSSHDPIAIARGLGWHTHDVSTPAALADVLGHAFTATGPQFVRVEVPSASEADH